MFERPTRYSGIVSVRSKSFSRILDIPHFPVGQGGNALKCREHFRPWPPGITLYKQRKSMYKKASR